MNANRHHVYMAFASIKRMALDASVSLVNFYNNNFKNSDDYFDFKDFLVICVTSNTTNVIQIRV